MIVEYIRSSSEFRKFLSRVNPFMSNIGDTQHYGLTKVTSNK